jgi:hypothetical protein
LHETDTHPQPAEKQQFPIDVCDDELIKKIFVTQIGVAVHTSSLKLSLQRCFGHKSPSTPTVVSRYILPELVEICRSCVHQQLMQVLLQSTTLLLPLLLHCCMLHAATALELPSSKIDGKWRRL